MTWEPDRKKDAGLYCKECRKRQPWKKLIVTYEKTTEGLMRLWWCPLCSTLLREDDMTDLALVYELEEART